MSILDFTTDLFRDPTNLRSFVDNPDKALNDAGLTDATPGQVHDLLPVVAESMPPDHPLQTVVHSLDPVAALQQLDFDEHQHHHATSIIDKVLAPAECRPDDHDDDHQTIHVGNWNVAADVDKALGEVNPFSPQADNGLGDDQADAADHYPDPADDHFHDHDHALDDHPVALDISALAWGKAIE
ncbi:IniB N-terminal domain-containing protein [Mycobacterium sp. MMS18-G62]